MRCEHFLFNASLTGLNLCSHFDVFKLFFCHSYEFSLWDISLPHSSLPNSKAASAKTEKFKNPIFPLQQRTNYIFTSAKVSIHYLGLQWHLRECTS